MKNVFLFLVIAVSLAVTACADKNLEPGQLDTANKAAQQFFRAQIVQDQQGTSLGCSGIDSDRDGTVTCTGNVPVERTFETPDGNEKTKVHMVLREALCSYKLAGGCKAKF